MKRYLFTLFTLMQMPAMVIAMNENDNKDNSELFDKLYTWFNDDPTLSGLRKTLDRLFSGLFEINWIDFCFGIICLFCLICLCCFVKEFARNGKRDFATFINDILPETAFLVFSSGMAIYYLGYAYGGTGENALTLLTRSMLSSFEMFLSKSNLIGIATNCKASPTYMLLFAIFHAWAVIVSMIFAITCFGKRVKDWIKGFDWQYMPGPPLHVFWGINEKSICLARSIYNKERSRIVFVDFPPDEEESTNGQGFSGILGLLSYKISIARRTANIRYLLLKSPISPAAPEAKGKDFLSTMNIRRLGRFMQKSGHVNFYVLTENKTFNLQAALNMLTSEACNPVQKIFCTTPKNKITTLLAADSHNKLQIIDDAREAIMELTAGYDHIAHPINFVDIDQRKGCVKTEKPFMAFIIGFGTTGQEALRFLYEFSAFPDNKGKKTPVRLHIFDSQIPNIKGDLYQDIPAMPELENSKEITFHPYDSGTTQFHQQLQTHIDCLNYVVIATGEDERNLQIAAQLYEYALQHRTDGLNKFRIFARLYSSSYEDKFRKVKMAYAHNFCPAIEYFGNPPNIYTYSRILDEAEKKRALKFEEAYNRAKKREIPSAPVASTKKRNKTIGADSNSQTAPTLLKMRGEYRKEIQNLSNEKHRYTKEILLGLNNIKDKPEPAEWPFQIDKSSDKKQWKTRLLNASICEHLRWYASHLMMGYLPMSAEEEKKAPKSCDERTKHHLCLTDWDELTKKDLDYQIYDYIVVKATIDMYYDTLC